jgi:hypothetical protein
MECAYGAADCLSTKNESRSKAFDNFCKAHPLDSITTAAFELTDKLRSATGNVLFRS